VTCPCVDGPNGNPKPVGEDGFEREDDDESSDPTDIFFSGSDDCDE
jgi:hypothetical protein